MSIHKTQHIKPDWVNSAMEQINWNSKRAIMSVESEHPFFVVMFVVVNIQLFYSTVDAFFVALTPAIFTLLLTSTWLVALLSDQRHEQWWVALISPLFLFPSTEWFHSNFVLLCFPRFHFHPLFISLYDPSMYSIYLTGTNPNLECHGIDKSLGSTQSWRSHIHRFEPTHTKQPQETEQHELNLDKKSNYDIYAHLT